MKKRLILFSILFLMILPSIVLAKTKVLNLKETLASESINANLSNYKETSDQVTIYLFRGNGCEHCENFLNYLSSIIDNYGKYFKLRSYEVWNNDDNQELMNKVGEYFNYDVTSKEFGVPFIIIGEETFSGFTDSKKTTILNAITEEYNANSKFDILEELGITENNGNGNCNNTNVIIWLVVLIVISTSLIVFVNVRANKKINERLENIERILKVRK